MLVDTIVDKKGSDILLLDIRDQAVFADYFLICNADNERQLNALAQSLTQDAKQKAQAPAINTEGRPDGGWVLIDFGDLVIHLFSAEKRRYYNLEDIWDQSRVVLRVH